MSDSQKPAGFGTGGFPNPADPLWKRLAKTLGVVAVALFGLVSCGYLLGGGEASESRPSKGHAEISCENAIKNAVGNVKNVSYSRETDLGNGNFALYGTVFSDMHGQLKFQCDVEDAMTGGKTNGSATVELGK